MSCVSAPRITSYNVCYTKLLRQHFAWNTVRTIWMDGRPHPSEYAQHTAMGFSTGEFVGRTLKVRTTHLKEGWLRRNGVPRSWNAELTEHFTRHGDYLTWHVYIDDPAYLEEPFFRNRDYVYSEDRITSYNVCYTKLLRSGSGH